MNLTERARRLLYPDAGDVGCGETFEQIDQFVELVLTGGDVEGTFPGIAAHLHGCGPCREDYEGLLAAVRDQGGLVGAPK